MALRLQQAAISVDIRQRKCVSAPGPADQEPAASSSAPCRSPPSGAIGHDLVAEINSGSSPAPCDGFSRGGFDRAVESPVSAIFDCLEHTLELAKVSASNIELVCLTGGTSRVPVIYDHLSARFGAERIRRLKGLHSVVQGLGYEAQLRQKTNS